MTDDENSVRDFVCGLAGELKTSATESLLGVYLHGSAVLGDWSQRASDVDVLVVVRNEMTPDVATRLAGVLCADRDCPGVGLEVSVVEAHAALAPSEPWPFVVHVTTGADDRKTVWGAQHGGDRDLILHYAVARQSGWTASGPEPEAVIGPIPRTTILDQLVQELRWAVEHAPESYAVLNACRALRYRSERLLCSKTQGGQWALAQLIQPNLVRAALEAQRLGTRPTITKPAIDWVLAIAEDLTA